MKFALRKTAAYCITLFSGKRSGSAGLQLVSSSYVQNNKQFTGHIRSHLPSVG
ncbi:hypothetical protein FB99_46960 (plasmid) [Pantoea agglomerans]|nr:hypothetical protein FB99_46960 [Pantoea agglomerans]